MIVNTNNHQGNSNLEVESRSLKIIDMMVGNRCPLGEEHPEVWEAISAPPKPRVREDLLNVLRGYLHPGLQAMDLVRSGSEALERALVLARKLNPGRPNFLSLEGDNYGSSLTAKSLGGYASQEIYPLYPGFYTSPRPLSESDISACIQTLARRCPPSTVAAAIVKPVNDDLLTLPEGFLEELKSFCDSHGILLAIDETNIGIGMLGKPFMLDTKPDLVIFGDSVAAGLPFGGVAFSQQAEAWMSSHCLSETAALEQLAVIERQGLMAQAPFTAQKIVKKLHNMFGDSLDIRGQGLLLRIKTVSSPIDWRNVVKRSYSKGVKLRAASDGALLMSPPLNLSDRELENSMDILGQIIDYELMLASELMRPHRRQ